MNELIAVEKIAQWQKPKAFVLDSVSLPITKRVYNIGAQRVYGVAKRRGRPPKNALALVALTPGKKRRTWSAAHREAQAAKMRAYWAKRKEG